MENLTLIIQDAERRKERLALKQYINEQKETRKIVKQLKRKVLFLSVILIALLMILKISL